MSPLQNPSWPVHLFVLSSKHSSKSARNLAVHARRVLNAEHKNNNTNIEHRPWCKRNGMAPSTPIITPPTTTTTLYCPGRRSLNGFVLLDSGSSCSCSVTTAFSMIVLRALGVFFIVVLSLHSFVSSPTSLDRARVCRRRKQFLSWSFCLRILFLVLLFSSLHHQAPWSCCDALLHRSHCLGRSLLHGRWTPERSSFAWCSVRSQWMKHMKDDCVIKLAFGAYILLLQEMSAMKMNERNKQKITEGKIIAETPAQAVETDLPANRNHEDEMTVNIDDNLEEDNDEQSVTMAETPAPHAVETDANRNTTMVKDDNTALTHRQERWKRGFLLLQQEMKAKEATLTPRAHRKEGTVETPAQAVETDLNENRNTAIELQTRKPMKKNRHKRMKKKKPPDDATINTDVISSVSATTYRSRGAHGTNLTGNQVQSNNTQFAIVIKEKKKKRLRKYWCHAPKT